MLVCYLKPRSSGLGSAVQCMLDGVSRVDVLDDDNSLSFTF